MWVTGTCAHDATRGAPMRATSLSMQFGSSVGRRRQGPSARSSPDPSRDRLAMLGRAPSESTIPHGVHRGDYLHRCRKLWTSTAFCRMTQDMASRHLQQPHQQHRKLQRLSSELLTFRPYSAPSARSSCGLRSSSQTNSGEGMHVPETCSRIIWLPLWHSVAPRGHDPRLCFPTLRK